MQVLRNNGIAQAIIKAHAAGKMVLGICGGYQMLGEELHDPEGVESDPKQLPGLGLLPLKTVLEGEKITRQVQFTFGGAPDECVGYEIHNGRTEFLDEKPALNKLMDGSEDGCRIANCIGTYIHGILDNKTVVDKLLEPFLKENVTTEFDYRQFREEQFDKLAEHVRRHADIERVIGMME